jgi:poly(A) polymerase Pap1
MTAVPGPTRKGLGVTPPLAWEEPTLLEEAATARLKDKMRQLKSYETEAKRRLRAEALLFVESLTCSWSSGVLKSRDKLGVSV